MVTSTGVSVLIINEVYLPGWKMGGPVRSLSAIVEALGDEFRFKLVTRDRDFKDDHAYPDLTPDRWTRVGKAEVLYLSPENLSWRSLRNAMLEAAPQVLYLNSFFDPGFTIKPLALRWLNRVPRSGVIVAPRGELTKGAMSLKPWKKQAYLTLAKAMRLYGNVTLHATAESEAADIRYYMPNANVCVVPVLAPLSPGANAQANENVSKIPGRLKVVFVSRISRKKNLNRALEVLKTVPATVEFNIFGPIEDPQYWQECEQLSRTLPSNIQVSYKGAIPPDRVVSTMREHHLFLFPTMNENFGHVIAEAFAGGCSVLISDQTPWRNLADKGVGWDLPLDRLDLFRDAVIECAQLDQSGFDARASRARLMVQDCTDVDDLRGRYRQMFLGAAQLPSRKNA